MHFLRTPPLCTTQSQSNSSRREYITSACLSASTLIMKLRQIMEVSRVKHIPHCDSLCYFGRTLPHVVLLTLLFFSGNDDMPTPVCFTTDHSISTTQTRCRPDISLLRNDSTCGVDSAQILAAQMQAGSSYMLSLLRTETSVGS